MVEVMVLSGPVGVGKTSFRDAMIGLVGARKVSTSEWIVKLTGVEQERGALQAAGERLDRESGGTWVADAVEADLRQHGDGVLLVDSARIAGQVEALRKRFGNVLHVHLHASDEELERRYLARDPAHREFATYAEVRRSPTEAAVGSLAAIADLVLDAEYVDARTLAEIAAAVGDGREGPPTASSM